MIVHAAASSKFLVRLYIILVILFFLYYSILLCDICMYMCTFSSFSLFFQASVFFSSAFFTFRVRRSCAIACELVRRHSDSLRLIVLFLCSYI